MHKTAHNTYTYRLLVLKRFFGKTLAGFGDIPWIMRRSLGNMGRQRTWYGM
jgi:hypothetical protein